MTKPRLLQRFDLLPVVEIEPRSDGRPIPSGSAAENPNGWLIYWQECLAARGFPTVEPLEPGSWLVPLESLSVAALGALLADHFAASPVDDSLPICERMNALSGGFALREGDDTLLRPACCGDLANLDDWEQAAGHTSSDWAMLWIGHPWASVRFDGTRLCISNCHESEPTETAFCFAPTSLLDAVGAAREILEANAERLAGRVKAQFPWVEDTNAVARHLLGLKSSN